MLDVGEVGGTATRGGGVYHHSGTPALPTPPHVDLDWVTAAYWASFENSVSSYDTPVTIFDATLLGVVGLQLCIISFKVGEECRRRCGGFARVDTEERR